MDDIRDTTDDTAAANADAAVHPLVASDPARYRQLRNGAVYDTQSHRIAASDRLRDGYAITSETSQLYHQRRRDLRIEAAAAARSGMSRLARGDELRAWSLIAQRQAELATDPARGRASTEAARFVGVAAGYLATPGSEPVADSASVVIPDAVVLRILDALRPRDPDDVIDADYSDISSDT